MGGRQWSGVPKTRCKWGFTRIGSEPDPVEPRVLLAPTGAPTFRAESALLGGRHPHHGPRWHIRRGS